MGWVLDSWGKYLLDGKDDVLVLILVSSWVVEVDVALLLIFRSFLWNLLGEEGWFMRFYLNRLEDLFVLHSFIHSIIRSFVHAFNHQALCTR